MDIFEKLGIDKNSETIKDEIAKLVNSDKLGSVKGILNELDSTKITELLNKFEPTISKVLYALLPDDIAKSILDKLNPDVKNEVEKIDQNYVDEINKKAEDTNILEDIGDKVKDTLGGLFK